jgi:serine/threonine protein kinase
VITGKGKVKVLDFGLAKPLRLFEPTPGKKRKNSAAHSKPDNITEAGILLGTVNYMSPEQASGEGKVSHLSDLFSLGVVLYEAATGQLPFDGDTYFQTIECITRQEPAPIEHIRPDAPAGLIAIIKRLMQKSPAERYQSATGVATDLKAVPR